MLPPIPPVEETAIHPKTGETITIGTWVTIPRFKKYFPLLFAEEMRMPQSVIVAFRYPENPSALVIHSNPRFSKKGPRFSAQRKQIHVEWVRLASLEIVAKGEMVEFLTHKNDTIRSYFTDVVHCGKNIVPFSQEKQDEH